jgi:hypothetical protein
MDRYNESREDARFENSKISVSVIDIVPCVVHLALGMYRGSEQLAGSRGYMAACRGFVVCVIRPCTAVLAVNIAREVPVKIETGPSNGRIRCLGDNSKALLVNLLEHEGGVVPTETPARIIQWVRGAVEHTDFRM